jgi:hypothetical protein
VVSITWRLWYNPHLPDQIDSKGIQLVFSRFSLVVSIVLTVVLAVSVAFAQKTVDKKVKKEEAKPAATPKPKDASKPLSPEQLVDSVLFIYGFGGGRTTLNQIRKTTFEKGKSTFTAADGKIDQAVYQRWIIRADSLAKEKIRLDQEFPNARYSLVYNGEKIFGIYNNTVFTPRDDAVKGLENSIFHGIEALFRYKENESKLELFGKEKQLGVEYYLFDVTDKQGRKTRFFVSTKTLRVMLLTYEDGGVKFTRRFYDQKYAQGTLVAYRTVLLAGERVIEESDISSITFGQKVEDDMFKAG